VLTAGIQWLWDVSHYVVGELQALKFTTGTLGLNVSLLDAALKDSIPHHSNATSRFPEKCFEKDEH